MTRVLFVTNGHGEAAIADRISRELLVIDSRIRIEHVALVGAVSSEHMQDVGPRRPMPSGGLIAMGNARNLAADIGAGLISLTLAQGRYLRAARGAYDVAVAVGDAYALAMTLRVRTRTVFVGSAKSVRVAPYGAFESRLLRRADACFVRDAATADALRRRRVIAEPANAIVDLFATDDDPAADVVVAGFAPAVALFPGSRDSAYDDARFLLAVVRELSDGMPDLGAAFSVARGLDAERFAGDAAAAGWDVVAGANSSMPFALRLRGRDVVRGWRGALGPLLARVSLVLGQAGTANEAAAAAGVPVIAFESERDRKSRWYRQRQRGLLGGALAVMPGNLGDAVAGVRAIVDDPARRSRMGDIGRAQMGGPGAARRIAARIAQLAAAS